MQVVYPWASCDRVEGYSKKLNCIPRGRLSVEGIRRKSMPYPQASCDKADGYPKKLKLYPKRKIKRKGKILSENGVKMRRNEVGLKV